MSVRWDLLVLGGGPAGAVTAALAADAGARVLLVERHGSGRDKVCGEFVSAEGCRVLERLGVLDGLVARGGHWIRTTRLSAADGTRIDCPLPTIDDGGGAALGVSRRLLDSTLLQRAADRGVEVREHHVAVEPCFDGGRVNGCRVRAVGAAGPGDALHATLVVAADGRRSLLARRLHAGLCDPRSSGPRSWFGLKTHLHGAGPRCVSRVELHLFDGGYAGVAPVEDERLNLCLMVRVAALRACDGSPDRLLAERLRRNPALRAAIGNARRAAPWCSVGPLGWGRRRPAAAGALFVGDAAGTIDPFCGEGMSNAMRAAEIVQPFIADALSAGRLTRRAARGYTASWSRCFAPVTRRVRLLGALLERPRIAGPTLRWLSRAPADWTPRLVRLTRTGVGD